MIRQKKPILVTGIHRSGSTWVGQVLSKSKDLRYVYEPFNIAMKSHAPPFNIWFKYLSQNYYSEEHSTIKQYIENYIFVTRVSTINELTDVDSLFKLKRFFFKVFDKLTKRSVIKDPLAILSAEWFFKVFNCDIVILIRHPAAFILSIKQKEWDFDFSNFLDQPHLVRDKLLPFKEELEDYSKNKRGLIDNGILLWNCIYKIVDDYRQKYSKDWYFVKHEEMSLSPTFEFQKLFEYLNLEFTNDVKDFVVKSTTAEIDNPIERNSIKNIKKWQTHLSVEEIERIKKGTSDIWKKFYSDADWC
jgi:hypothetical protein